MLGFSQSLADCWVSAAIQSKLLLVGDADWETGKVKESLGQTLAGLSHVHEALEGIHATHVPSDLIPGEARWQGPGIEQSLFCSPRAYRVREEIDNKK